MLQKVCVMTANHSLEVQFLHIPLRDIIFIKTNKNFIFIMLYSQNSKLYKNKNDSDCT